MKYLVGMLSSLVLAYMVGVMITYMTLESTRREDIYSGDEL